MLFSCLVDADFLETEAFYARANTESPGRGGYTPLTDLRDRLWRHMADLRAHARSSDLNALRTRILEHATQKHTSAPGLFTLTVPTGGGKTLASLSFALQHAVTHGMDRVIYVIPFTSIIEQTAAVFRKALDTDSDILEHHASFDWEAKGANQDEGHGPTDRLRKAAENWDAPIIVTTAVQFFESLFANRTSRCRKLHNIANAVIVLDEAQSLPLHVLHPSLAALDELQRNYRSSIVLCTATQPAWRKDDNALIDKQRRNLGFQIDPDRELAPDPIDLYQRLKRVQVEVQPGETTDGDIVACFRAQEQMLCIVNSRPHARALYDAISDLPGAVHLSTLMCPRHRRAVLADVRKRLHPDNPQPVRLVATSLIEAGVDVDFPEVWRAVAGLDSIAQAAGRCNREGRLSSGRVVVFRPAGVKPPHAIKQFWQATEPLLDQHEDDLLSLAAVRAYFKNLYFNKGPDALDATEVDNRQGVLNALKERAKDLSFAFESLGKSFRLIDDAMESVVVPWDDEAHRLLATIRATERPMRRHLRGLQQYVVSIPIKKRQYWLGVGALSPVHPALGDGLLAFSDCALYRDATGLDLDSVDLRDVESNIIA